MMQAERLTLARESISEAKFLYGEGIGNKVVFPKLYHALIAQFLGQGMHVGYGYRDKEGQKDHSAGGASHATIP